METTALYLCTALFILHFSTTLRRPKNSPPSPLSFPLIGHLHLLSKPLHRSLASLSARHGPILSLHFGSRPVLLISSFSAAESCFSENDAAFSNRPRFLAGKHLGYNYSTLVWTSDGPHWRNLRRIAALEIFSPSRLHSITDLISQEIAALVKSLAATVRIGGRAIEMRPRLFELNLHLMMKLIAGKTLNQSDEFREIVRETFDVSGSTNMGDFIPLLRLFDYSGVEKKMIKLQQRRDTFLQELIDERRREIERMDSSSDFDRQGAAGADERERKCLIDNLLSLQKVNPEQYTDEIIKGLVVVLLSAGTDTTALTTEWALALLLRNPTALSKAREELDGHVGAHCLINDTHLPNLPYLHSVIKETLRLHPVAALIPAHESNRDCTIEGFRVPKGVLLLVNAWAINRDPSLWVEPEEFRPERWEGGGGTRGKQGKVLFFGMGRRGCPGEGLAMRVMGLALGALIQCFEWDVDGVGERVDLTEGSGGLLMPMAKPLRVLCKTRGVVDQIGLGM